MKVRDRATGDVYEALRIEQVETRPHPDVEDEVLVDTISPAGDPVVMSVRLGQENVFLLTNEDGYRMLHPDFSWDIFEEVTDNG